MSRCQLLLRQCRSHAGSGGGGWVAASCRAGGRWVDAQLPWMVLRRCVRRPERPASAQARPDKLGQVPTAAVGQVPLRQLGHTVEE